MLKTILAAAAVSLAMSSAGFAQDSDTNHPPVPWLDNSATEAFFTDSTGTTMRSDDEIKTNYGAMSAEQQMKIKNGCKSMNSGAVDPQANSASGDGPAATGGGTGTHTQDVGMNMSKVCSMVDTM